jgi:hypothetical protein
MELVIKETSFLCESELIVWIGKERYEFPRFFLESGGKSYYDESFNIVTDIGPWAIKNWPKNFPEEHKKEVLKQLNKKLTWGCCGGCVDETSL